ncbi:hypothetical protein V6N11_039335 [Hibiscus sabdariffa]|uniref:RNase H type-1 domain-containing protein n=1 Tax=Hibiscus sabdariffa TaxID=183260 RepID=A0ABR2SNJ0_9ROSI
MECDDRRTVLERSMALVWTTKQGEDALRLFYSNPECGRYISVVKHIGALLKQNWLVQCRRIHWNGNRVADAMAKLPDLSCFECSCFLRPPLFVAGVLKADMDMLTVS